MKKHLTRLKPLRLCLSLCLMAVLSLTPCIESSATSAPPVDANGYTDDYLNSSRDITFDNAQRTREVGTVPAVEKKVYIHPSAFTDASNLSIILYQGGNFNFGNGSFLSFEIKDLQIQAINGLQVTDTRFWIICGTGEKIYLSRVGTWFSGFSADGFHGDILEIGVDISFSSAFTSPMFHFQFDKFGEGYITQNESSGIGYSWFNAKPVSVIPLTVKWSGINISSQNVNSRFENNLYDQFNSLKDHISATSGKSDAIIQQQTQQQHEDANNIMNGYDSSAGNTANEQLQGSLGSLDEVQNNLFDSAGDMIEFDDYKNIFNLPGIITSVGFVSSVLTSIFQNSGTFGIILIVGFLLFIITRLLGMQSFIGK